MRVADLSDVVYRINCLLMNDMFASQEGSVDIYIAASDSVLEVAEQKRQTAGYQVDIVRVR